MSKYSDEVEANTPQTPPIADISAARPLSSPGAMSLKRPAPGAAKAAKGPHNPLNCLASAAAAARVRADSPSILLCMRAPALDQSENFFFLHKKHKFDTGLAPNVEKTLALKLVHAFPPSLSIHKRTRPARLHDVVPIVLDALLDLKSKSAELRANAARADSATGPAEPKAKRSA